MNLIPNLGREAQVPSSISQFEVRRIDAGLLATEGSGVFAIGDGSAVVEPREGVNLEPRPTVF